MADQIVEFVSFLTPDVGSAGAVFGVSGAGHTASPITTSVSRGCKWFNLANPSSPYLALRLKVDYVLTDFIGSNDCIFYIQYSTDGGNNWTEIVRVTSVTFGPNSGAFTIELPVVLASLIQVRDFGFLNVGATYSMTVSNLKVEVDYIHSPSTVMM